MLTRLSVSSVSSSPSPSRCKAQEGPGANRHFLACIYHRPELPYPWEMRQARQVPEVEFSGLSRFGKPQLAVFYHMQLSFHRQYSRSFHIVPDVGHIQQFTADRMRFISCLATSSGMGFVCLLLSAIPRARGKILLLINKAGRRPRHWRPHYHDHQPNPSSPTMPRPINPPLRSLRYLDHSPALGQY
jgi:hypothetical protein